MGVRGVHNDISRDTSHHGDHRNRRGHHCGIVAWRYIVNVVHYHRAVPAVCVYDDKVTGTEME